MRKIEKISETKINPSLRDTIKKKKIDRQILQVHIGRIGRFPAKVSLSFLSWESLLISSSLSRFVSGIAMLPRENIWEFETNNVPRRIASRCSAILKKERKNRRKSQSGRRKVQINEGVIEERPARSRAPPRPLSPTCALRRVEWT
jgi:hypothetical protein